MGVQDETVETVNPESHSQVVSSGNVLPVEEEPTSRRRRRRRLVQLAPAEEQGTVLAVESSESISSPFTPSIPGKMMLLELPDALRENIMRFSSVHSPDFLSLACTCRQLLQEVEAFSKKELDRITREHNVDDDWLYRAGMQAGATGQQQDGWYIPSSVSQRRMLRSAYRIHIYSLGTDPSQEWTGVIGLAMHPDGKRMLSGGAWE
jgi:hypothetical protein